jgi:4'-phosphopantetheinyl transferase
MRDLGPAQIHLWQYPIGQPPIAQHVAHAMTLLSDAEKCRSEAFYFEKHRTEYALSHAMLRLVLSEYAPVRPETWQFVTNEWGKPEIGGPRLAVPLWFNLSHTDGFIACVAGRVRPLGVDVEDTNQMASYDEMAKHFFAPAEQEYLSSLTPGHQREAFFRIWTLKEAYIKALGKGLSIPLDSFHFRFSPSNPSEATLEGDSASGASSWRFFEFRPGANHQISIAVQSSEHDEFHVECHDAAALFRSGTARPVIAARVYP